VSSKGRAAGPAFVHVLVHVHVHVHVFVVVLAGSDQT
jgi:hypothetical protein